MLTGLAENKSVQELLPGILSQMGPAGLKALTEQLVKGKGGLPKGREGLAAAAAGAAAAGGAAGGEEEEMPNIEAGASFE